MIVTRPSIGTMPPTICTPPLNSTDRIARTPPNAGTRALKPASSRVTLTRLPTRFNKRQSATPNEPKTYEPKPSSLKTTSAACSILNFGKMAI